MNTQQIAADRSAAVVAAMEYSHEGVRMSKKITDSLGVGEDLAIIEGENLMEDQEFNFKLPNGAEVNVWVDEKGNLQVCATSMGTTLTIEPRTNGSISVTAVKS